MPATTTRTTPLLEALVRAAPLLDVVSIDLQKGLITLDISNLAEVPMARRIGLLPYSAETKAALVESRTSAHLAGFGPAKRARFRGDEDSVALEITDDFGNEDTYRQYLFQPDGWQPSWWRPHRWTHHAQRVDNHGRRWINSSNADYVVDNFGDLVEVAA